MVCDNAETDIMAGIIPVGQAGQTFCLSDHREYLICLINILLALEKVCYTFKAHTCINVLAVKLANNMEVSFRLHIIDFKILKDKVPDLNIPCFGSDRAAVRAILRPPVHIDFRAWPAGPRTSCSPEVIFHTEHLHMFRVHAFVPPQCTRLIVIGISGDP